MTNEHEHYLPLDQAKENLDALLAAGLISQDDHDNNLAAARDGIPDEVEVEGVLVDTGNRHRKPHPDNA